MRVYFCNIHSGAGQRKGNIYAELRNCETRDLEIGATVEYCLDAIRTRKWTVERGPDENGGQR